MPGHPGADRAEICVADRGLVDEAALEHDKDAVGEFEDLVKVFAQQLDRDAAVARRDDLRADLGDGEEIEPEASTSRFSPPAAGG
jgi:hypothetical protein